MANYKIICNNTIDLPQNLIDELDLTVLPLGFTIGDDSYKTMAATEFYQKIKDGAMPTTNAASLGEWIDTFEPVLKEGQDVLCIAFNSALSLTHNAALMAAAELAETYPNQKIIIVDSLSASIGEGLLVHMAALMRKEGKSIEEVRDHLEASKGNIAHWVTVDDLGHLKRGGRISGAQAVLGGMLGVKPLLKIDDSGKLVPADKIRGRAASLQKLVSLATEGAINPSENIVGIAHSACLEDAQEVAKGIQEAINPKEIILSDIGPVIGSHTGVGVIAVCYLSDKR